MLKPGRLWIKRFRTEKFHEQIGPIRLTKFFEEVDLVCTLRLLSSSKKSQFADGAKCCGPLMISERLQVV